LDLQTIVEILGERPYPPKSNFKAYLEYKNKEEKFAKEMEEVRKEDENDENNDKKENEDEKAPSPQAS